MGLVYLVTYIWIHVFYFYGKSKCIYVYIYKYTWMFLRSLEKVKHILSQMAVIYWEFTMVESVKNHQKNKSQYTMPKKSIYLHLPSKLPKSR